MALSSRYRSIFRPNKLPFALMSPMTILATFALAIPQNESGPVWSVITPPLMESLTGVDARARCASAESCWCRC